MDVLVLWMCLFCAVITYVRASCMAREGMTARRVAGDPWAGSGTGESSFMSHYLLASSPVPPHHGINMLISPIYKLYLKPCIDRSDAGFSCGIDMLISHVYKPYIKPYINQSDAVFPSAKFRSTAAHGGLRQNTFVLAKTIHGVVRYRGDCRAGETYAIWLYCLYC